MKEIALKFTAALLVVGVAGTCAFAQQHNSSNTASQTRSLEKSGTVIKTSTAEKTTVKTVEPAKEVYRSVEGTESRTVTDRNGNVVGERPIVKKVAAESRSVESTPRVRRETVAPSEAKKIPANAVRATSAINTQASQPYVKTDRVNNTSKAVPANYKPTVEETKPTEK